MKRIIFLIVTMVVVCNLLSAQGKYKMTKSAVSFFSDAPLEDIEANNTQAQCIIDFDSKNFVVKIPVKDFKFKSALMQDHFNENYMESDKYPFAIFKGVLQGNIDLVKDGEYAVNAVGDFDLHGVTQKRTIPCTLVVKNGEVNVKSKFNIKLADHKINIPQLVFEKIAEVVEVQLHGVLSKM